MKILTRVKKSLGQNFLTDQNIIKKIVEIGNINQNKTVMEIGPGYGGLTKTIIDMKPKKIIAIEKDKKLSEILKKKFNINKSVEIINDDALKVINKKTLEKNIVVFGNLPYNISTQILASLITLEDWPPWYETLIFMFQKEVAARIVAKSQTKEFGRLTVLSNWRLEIKKHFNISRNCFFPMPKVDSTLLSFKPIKDNQFNLKNPKTLEKITRILFSNKRKMINKNFVKLFGQNKSIAKKLNINLSQRPEEISSEKFYEIAAEYEKLNN